jgi:hypothetical protein
VLCRVGLHHSVACLYMCRLIGPKHVFGQGTYIILVNFIAPNTFDGERL